MNLKEFLKPDIRKIVVFFVLLFIAPFPYFIAESSICVAIPGVVCEPEWVSGIIFGFPILLLFLSRSFTHIVTIKGDFYDDVGRIFNPEFPHRFNFILYISNLIFCFILSCFLIWIYDRVKKR